LGHLALKQFLRKHLRTDSVSFEDYEDTLKDPEVVETVTIKSERDKALYKALDKLPLDYRTALYLTYFEGFSSEEAAKITGRSRKQIENLLYNARKALRTELEKEGFRYENL